MNVFPKLTSRTNFQPGLKILPRIGKQNSPVMTKSLENFKNYTQRADKNNESPTDDRRSGNLTPQKIIAFDSPQKFIAFDYPSMMSRRFESRNSKNRPCVHKKPTPKNGQMKAFNEILNGQKLNKDRVKTASQVTKRTIMMKSQRHIENTKTIYH